MKKVLLIAVGVIVGVPALLYVVGLFVPVGHVASSRAVFHRPPEEVWATLSDFATWPDWSSAFDTMERQPDRDGKPYWIARGGFGPLPMVVEELDPPRRLVTRIPEDADIGFGGTWTYEVAPVEGGASVTLTEAGEVRSPLFRGIATLFLGHHTAMNALLEDLGGKLGEDVEPEAVDRGGE